MNDELSVKAISPSTLDSANFPGTALAFPRIQQTTSNEHRRRNMALGSTSPTTLKVIQNPRTSKNALQRSSLVTEQVLSRVDSEDNEIRSDTFSLGTTGYIPAGVTLEEFRSLVKLHIGIILADDMAMIDRLYNQET